LLTPDGQMSADVQWFSQWLSDALRAEFPQAFTVAGRGPL